MTGGRHFQPPVTLLERKRSVYCLKISLFICFSASKKHHSVTFTDLTPLGNNYRGEVSSGCGREKKSRAAGLRAAQEPRPTEGRPWGHRQPVPERPAGRTALLQVLRRQREAGAEKAPAARSGEPQRGTLRCAIAVRSRRAHARAERPTSARAVEGAVRSTPAAAHAMRPKACAIRVDRGARWLNTCRRPSSSFPKRSATIPSSFEDLVSPSRRKRRPYRTVFMGGRSEDTGLPVGGRAGRGGSHGAAWVRVRVNPRAWQRLPRRLQSALAGPPRA